jgi:GAF domain-containing protein
VPLPADRPLGVLSLLSVNPNAFDRDDIAVGHMLARHAAVAVANATNEQNLRAAIDSRKLVGQAQGILMERYRLDADQAFAVLRRYSQDYNIKLREVAQRLIETRELPERLASNPTLHRGAEAQPDRERHVPGKPR